MKTIPARTSAVTARRAEIGDRRFLPAALLAGVFALSGPSGAQAYTYTKIVDTNTISPQGAKFTAMVSPAISGTTVAFRAYFSGGSGIYTEAVGSSWITRVVDTATASPEGPVFRNLGDPLFGGGNTLVFYGDYVNGSNGYTYSGVYTGAVGVAGAVRVVDMTMTAPEGGLFTEFNLDPAAIGGSNIAYTGTYTSEGGGVGIYSTPVGTPGGTRLIDTTSSLTPGGQSFTELGGVAISGNQVAFLAGYQGGSTQGAGIYTVSLTTPRAARIVDYTFSAPGHSAFDGLGSPTISGTQVAFAGSFSGGSGIYTGTVGSQGATRVVDTSTVVPGHTAFIQFDSPVISGSNVAFVGYYSGGNASRGLYVASGSQLLGILATGDALFGSTITLLEIGSSSLDGNNLTFYYELANGVKGIAATTL